MGETIGDLEALVNARPDFRPITRIRRRVGCCLPVLSASSTASLVGSLTVSVFLLAVSALTQTTRLPAPMNTIVSLCRPMMKFLP